MKRITKRRSVRGVLTVLVAGGLGAIAFVGIGTSPPQAQGSSLHAQLVSTSSRTAEDASGQGYWMVASDGGVFAFGNAKFYGSMGGQHLNSPIVNIVGTPDGMGYWLVAKDGGIFTFGDAHFYGSMGGTHLNQSIVGGAGLNFGSAQGPGYWEVASVSPSGTPVQRWGTHITAANHPATGVYTFTVDDPSQGTVPGGTTTIFVTVNDTGTVGGVIGTASEINGVVTVHIDSVNFGLMDAQFSLTIIP